MSKKVTLEKQLFMEFLLFEWWGEPDLWKIHTLSPKNIHLVCMKEWRKDYEQAVTYIEQGGNVPWDLNGRHKQLLNSLIPSKNNNRWVMNEKWVEYRDEFYSNPRKIKHKFEY